jgi:hypothetical protein
MLKAARFAAFPILFLALAFSFSPSLLAQDQPQVLTNASVLQMLQWKMKPAEIVVVIGRNGGNTNFSLDAQSVRSLTDQGATDEVIDAMLRAVKKAARNDPAAVSQKQSGVNTAQIHSQQVADPPPTQNSTQTLAAAQGDAGQPPTNPATSPPPAPQVPPVSGAPVTQPAPGGQPAAGGGNAGSTQNILPPPTDAALQQAMAPIVRARKPSPLQLTSSRKTYQLDYTHATASPNTITESGDSILRLLHANPILYDYEFNVQEIKGSSDDLSQWSALINETKGILPNASNATAFPGSCPLAGELATAKQDLQTIDTNIKAMAPDKLSNGNFKSVTYDISKGQWNDIRALYDGFEDRVVKIQSDLALPACKTEPDTVAAAVALITAEFPRMRDRVDAIQARVDTPCQDVFPLNRTSDFDITVTEKYNGVATEAKPVVFHLNRGFDVLTLSGGFLLTKLQALSYSSVAQPVPPPLGSPPNTPPGTQNVLGVDGLGRGFRPALVALFNYHDPFDWVGNRPNFGLAFSVGPVIDISNGRADTSKFGLFTGGSVHFWNRLFLTAGMHFGEFSDFPLGFHAPGDLLPANAGTPLGRKRWTGRFAFAITFKGKDLSGLMPNANSQDQSKK